MSSRVVVVGGGIIGVSTALAIARKNIPNVNITVIAKDFSPLTTGDGSAGIWWPYLIGDQMPTEDLVSLCRDSFEFLTKMLVGDNLVDHGIGLLSSFMIYREHELPDYPFKDVLFNYRQMTRKEMDLFPVDYKSGLFVTAFFVECPKLLPVLMKEFKSLGGKFVKREVNCFDDFANECDVLVNCTGLASKQLADDKSVFGIRGQVHRVRANWIKHAVFAVDHYIIPNSDCVILGGTHQVDDYNLNIDPNDKKFILDGCKKLMRSLEKAEPISDFVGIRPGRPAIRIEKEMKTMPNGQKLNIVHNYGHGGSGVTLFWGSAIRAADLVEKILKKVQIKSKL